MTSTSPRFVGPDLRGIVLDDRYLLERQFAHGGSGNVYVAVDRRLRRRVAVKVIHSEYARHEVQRLRIRQEALLGAQLAHPNVIQIYDFGEEFDLRGEVRPYIVMPLLHGRSLRQVVLDGWVRWERAAWWIHQLLCGLSAIHGAGVIHRDIKLDNCLLVREGGREVLKVLDLGLAKVTRADLLSRPPRSSAGRLVGSLPYMSPEQARCEELDQRTDIYAVGVALFELLTRRQPFVGSDYEVLSGHVEAPPPRPSEVAPLAEIPPALDGLVLRALAKRREERFASAGDFDAALLDALEGLDVDVERGLASAGCDEAKACLEAWASFDIERASGQADIAAQLDPGWSPLKIVMALSREE